MGAELRFQKGGMSMGDDGDDDFFDGDSDEEPDDE
jgi:hypothetical protein